MTQSKGNLRRGFKTEAAEISRELRTELGVAWYGPLSPWRLAEHLAIQVLPMSHLSKVALRAVRLFSGAEQSSFSAVTVFDGIRRIIVNNDSHSHGRQANDVSHELSHGLLHHPPSPAIDNRGCRFWDTEIEEEAQWLGAVLLVPDEAALYIIRNKISIEVASSEYCVSKRLMTYRLQKSNARIRVERETKHRSHR